jgi:hypothetical protein
MEVRNPILEYHDSPQRRFSHLNNSKHSKMLKKQPYSMNLGQGAVESIVKVSTDSRLSGLNYPQIKNGATKLPPLN